MTHDDEPFAAAVLLNLIYIYHLENISQGILCGVNRHFYT